MEIEKEYIFLLVLVEIVSMPTSSSIVRDSINEPRRSRRRKVETSFDPNFLTNFSIEDFEVNFLTNESISTFFIQEDPKTYEEAMRSIYISL